MNDKSLKVILVDHFLNHDLMANLAVDRITYNRSHFMRNSKSNLIKNKEQ